MKQFLFLLVLPLVFSCKTQKEAVNTSTTNTTTTATADTTTTESSESPEPDDSYTKPQKPYRVKASLGDPRKKTDMYYILSASVEGNLLIMDIEYSGGCALHSFEFIGSTAVSKSLPPQRRVKLMHDNGDDMCESMVQQTIEVDISPLAYQQKSGSEIILNLEGFEEPLKYTYP